VDVTTGTVTGIDVVFPGLSAFDSLVASNAFATDWLVRANQGLGSQFLFDLIFTPAPTPGSLVGFTGGTNVGSHVILSRTTADVYRGSSGSITPVTAAPEPSSLALLPLGLGALLLLRKRMIRPLAV